MATFYLGALVLPLLTLEINVLKNLNKSPKMKPLAGCFLIYLNCISIF